jgi:hypothetical protein
MGERKLKHKEKITECRACAARRMTRYSTLAMPDNAPKPRAVALVKTDTTALEAPPSMVRKGEFLKRFEVKDRF